MRNNRKEIDIFLIELDKFIGKNMSNLSEDDIFDLIFPLKAVAPSSFGPSDKLELDTILPFVNKGDSSKRGVNYIRRVAYKIDYIKVKGTSYNEIFSKILFNKSNFKFKIKGLRLKDFYKDNTCKEFIIPDDYGQVNLDMYYLGDYEIIK